MLLPYKDILSAVTLESTYGAARSFTVLSTDASIAELDVTYTTGAAETNNVLSIKIETSNGDDPATATFHQVTNAVASGADITFTQGTGLFTGASAATAYSLSAMIKDLASKWLKISFLETGVASNKGTVTASITLANHDR